MLALDLCCGSGGWTDGFLAAGFRVTGVDIVPQPDYQGEFILGDVRLLDGHLFKGYDVIVASPPCQEFSRWRMPWLRHLRREPDLSIIKGCWRIRAEAQPKFFILENVREAQRWLGPATVAREPYYLWGDVFLVSPPRRVKKESISGARPDLRSRIPFDMAFGIALTLRGTLEKYARIADGVGGLR